MGWGNRQHPDDSGDRPEWGKRKCPRCGEWVTTNARGFSSHLRSCLRKKVVVNGVEYPEVPEEEIPEKWRQSKP